MSKEVFTVSPDLPVARLARLLTDKMISGAPVVDQDKNLIGVVSLADIGKTMARASQEGISCGIARAKPDYSEYYYGHSWGYGHLAEHQIPETQTVADIMTNLVLDIAEDAEILELADLMANFRVHRVIVTRQKKVVGLVSNLDLVDVLRAMLRKEIHA